MKRSEMVQTLEKIINSKLYQDYQFSNEEISDLLAEIEQSGMQPPNITKMPDTWFRSTGDYGYEVAEWEDE